MSSVTTSADRSAEIMTRADELATYTEDVGIIHRPYGTPSLLSARNLVANWMRDAGMSTHVDALGNLFGRYDARPDGDQDRTVVLGGHFDSVRDAGRYDGTLGVLVAISVVAQLTESNQRLPFAIEVAAFADEEGLRFQSTFLGSSPLAGLWDPAWLDFIDSEGTSLRGAVTAFGGDPDRIAELERPPGEMIAFIETHIEQGPVLEAANLPVGVVSGITGSQRAQIEVIGAAGHAGTVPMAHRQDALSAMAEIILAVEHTARASDRLVATIGKLDIEPGGPNVIAGRTVAILDLRHPDGQTRSAGIAAIHDACTGICARRNVTLNWSGVPGFVETPSDPHLIDVLSAAIAAKGIEPLTLLSGAGHDAVTISRIAPVVMLFVRCRAGISHNPAESIDVADVEVALRVVDHFVASLAGEVAH